MNRRIITSQLMAGGEAEVTVDIPNTFDPDYRKARNKSSSNLKDNMGEGVR